MPTPAEQRFIDAWRYAGPQLEEIRRRELRELDEQAGLRMLGANVPVQHAESGLIQFQAWMMRLRVIEMQRTIKQLAAAASPPQ